MVKFILIITFLLLFIVSLLLYKDIFYPTVILNFIYLFDVAIFAISKYITKSTYDLNEYCYVFLIGLIIFNIATYTVFLYSKNNIMPKVEAEKNVDITLIYKIVIIIQLILVVVFITDIVLNSNFDFDPGIIDYIKSAKDGYYTERYIFKLLRTFSFALSFVGVYYIAKNKILDDKIWLYIQFAIALIYMLLYSARAVWFILLIPSVGILLYFLSRNKFNIIKTVILLLVVFMLFFIVNSLRGQRIGITDLRLYLCSGMISFSEWLKNINDRTYGTYIFRVPLKILNKIGLYNGRIDWIEQASLDIDIDWWLGNVYSFYHGYARDFGIYFAFFIQFVCGIIHGVLYTMFRKKDNAFWTCLFFVSLYPLILQFFADFYISHISLWLQITLYLLIVCKTNILYIKNNN